MPLLAHQRLAMELATMLHPVVPASVATLCLDLTCRPRALKRAADTLIEYGVIAIEHDHGYTVDPETWRQCQRVANGYVSEREAESAIGRHGRPAKR